MSKPKTAKAQCQKILADLERGKSVTSFDGFKKYNAIRLTARIWDLKNGVYDGIKYDIKDVTVRKNDTHYKRYFLKRAV